MNDNSSRLVPSQRRLQRPPDFTGHQLNTFSAVFLRHGLPGALLGLLLLLPDDTRGVLLVASERAIANPGHYAAAAATILLCLSVYAITINRCWNLKQTAWILYLGGLSAWEEWLFRLALPYGLHLLGMDLVLAALVCNGLFGLVHYFTLRWKWPWCIGAFLGGLGLSGQLERTEDLLLIIGIHWIVTFINTPRMPGERADSSTRA